MEKNVYAQMYVEQYKEKLGSVLEQLRFYSGGFWVECRIDENILLKGINESRLKAYQLRENILEIEEGSYTKKELNKIDKKILGYYFRHEKQLRKQFKKELALNEKFCLDRNCSLRSLNEVDGMILSNMVLTY